jgi:hypothetical protein
MTGEIKLQNVDMGIALCHFEAAARESGLSGNWTEARPAFDAGTWEYSLSWTKDE